MNAIAFDETGSRTLEVPTGRYSVMAYAIGGDEADWANSITLLGDPDEWIGTRPDVHVRCPDRAQGDGQDSAAGRRAEHRDRLAPQGR